MILFDLVFLFLPFTFTSNYTEVTTYKDDSYQYDTKLLLCNWKTIVVKQFLSNIMMLPFLASNDVGYVLATDISLQMLRIAKQRAAALGLQDIIEFIEGDAEMLELPESSFDAVLSRWGLMFIVNLNTALGRIYQSLVSDGRFVFAVWAEASKVPFISFPLNIVMHELNVPPPPPGTPGPFALSDIDILQNALSSARFTDIKYERLNVTFEFARVEDYINYTKDIGSTIKIMLSKESVNRQEEIWNIVTEQVRNNYAAVNNQQLMKIDNECICMTAKKP